MTDTLITVVLEDHSLDLVRPANNLTLAASGPQGAAGTPGSTGPAGAPGGSAYEHIQSSAAATWNVNHNLGRLAHVSILETDGTEIEADVAHASINTVVITFPSPHTGTVIVS